MPCAKSATRSDAKKIAFFNLIVRKVIQPNAGVAGDDELAMHANSASIFTMQYILSSLTVLLGGLWSSALYACLFQWLSGVFERL